MNTDVFITLANNQPVISNYYNICSVIIVWLFIIYLIYAFLNFVAWVIEDIVYCKKWWLKKWNFLKTNFVKHFKKLLFPTIWFLWFMTVWYQVSFWDYFIQFIETFCPDFSLLTKWAKALNYMTALYVLIIFSIAYIIIWLSFWKKALLKTWIGIYIFWVILCYAVPLLSNFFQVKCYDEEWKINKNPDFDSFWNVVNCYDKNHEKDWIWDFEDEYFYHHTLNYKNWTLDWYQWLHYWDWILEWADIYDNWFLVGSHHFYHDWQTKIRWYFEDWLYKTFEFYENWQLKEERSYSWDVLEWRQMSYDEDGSIIYQWYFSEGNLVDVSDQMPLM